MPTQCWSSVNGEVMRLTRLDNCCTPPAAGAACSTIVTDGFVSIGYSPEIAEGEDIELKNAKGRVCASKPGCDELKWFNLEMNFCNIDPDVFAFVTGNPLVLDASGDSVGNDVLAGATCTSNFALEVWTEIPSEECADGGFAQYGYFLVPCITNGIIGDFTIENDALTLQLNANSKSGTGWGVGPYDVQASDNLLNTPGPLITPVGAKAQLRMFRTTIAPPVPSCGCVAMGPIVATGATAGSPGTFTPAGADTPANLAAMAGIVASPATAWTIGQHVVLGDASHAHWDGVAWIAGDAP